MTDLHNHVVRRRRRAEGGFTLIELLVVIAILSVLATIVIINVVGVKSSANTAACSTDAQEVQTALTEYYDVADTYPFAAGTVLTLPTSAVANQLVPFQHRHRRSGNPVPELHRLQRGRRQPQR